MKGMTKLYTFADVPLRFKNVISFMGNDTSTNLLSTRTAEDGTEIAGTVGRKCRRRKESREFEEEAPRKTRVSVRITFGDYDSEETERDERR